MTPGKLIGRGRTADVFEWGRGRVIKLYHAEVTDEHIEREAHNTRVACEAGAPAPAVFDTVSVDGRRGTLFERVNGPSLQSALATHPRRLLAYARLLAELHANIHARRAPTLPRQPSTLEQRLNLAPGLTKTRRAAILTRLRQLPEGASLCHNDLHPGNVILAERGPVIIDWVDATCGHPLADVARCLYLIVDAIPAADTRIPRALLMARRFWGRLYFNHYCRLRSVSRKEVDDWLVAVLAVRLSESVPEEQRRILQRMSRLGIGQ